MTRKSAMTGMDSGTAGSERVIFEATLVPHCSLSPTGFVVIMAAIITMSLAISIGFLLVGAWPVIGFFGLDVILVYAAFRMGYRAARRREYVRLSPDRLEIIASDAPGRFRRTVLQPYWARIDLQPRPGGRLRLLLRSHGREIELGTFLGPDEKSAFADALSEALVRARSQAAHF